MVAFQSTLSMRRATNTVAAIVRNSAISIHALHEESDHANVAVDHSILISIHALHEESDGVARRALISASVFQSTLSMRRATGCLKWLEGTPVISIHALHEESDPHSWRLFAKKCISIHALHEESDVRVDVLILSAFGISIHALHEESDRIHRQAHCSQRYFNPRSP